MADGTLSEVDYGDVRDFDIDPNERCAGRSLPGQGQGWLDRLHRSLLDDHADPRAGHRRSKRLPNMTRVAKSIRPKL